MKTTDIAKKFGIDVGDFEHFIKITKKKYDEGFIHTHVNDSDVEAYVEEYRRYAETKKQEAMAKQKAEQERIAAEQREAAKRVAAEQTAAAEKREAMARMLISSGFSFDGYKIVKYSGYISGDDATQIPRSGVFGGKNGENLTKALVQIRRQALAELKEAAYDLGCNAVVGVDFDYITLEPETANLGGGTLYEPYIICVTANGNAVVIEKE